MSIGISLTISIGCGGLVATCVSGRIVSGRPAVAVITLFKFAILNVLLEDLDIVDNTNRRSVLGRRLVLWIG